MLYWYFDDTIDGVSRYIENPEWERKRKEQDLESLQKEIDSLTRILSEKEIRLKNLKEELQNKK